MGETLCGVLMSHDLIQASSKEKAAGSSSHEQSDSGAAAGTSSATSEGTGRVSQSDPDLGSLSVLGGCKREDGLNK